MCLFELWFSQVKYVRKRKINIVYECLYMESRKILQMSLFAGLEDRHRYREQTCGHSGGREG